MTDQDNLRDRIETILDRFTGESWEHHHRDAAQAIIDEFDLAVEDGTAWESAPAGPIPVPAVRVVGKWEKQ